MDQEDKNYNLRESKISFQNNEDQMLSSTLVEKCEEMQEQFKKSDEIIGFQQTLEANDTKTMNSIEAENDGNNTEITTFQKELNKLNECLNVKLIEQYLEQGESAVNKAKGQDICILVGTTGAGKTTTLLYLIGEEMEKKEISSESKDELENIQQFKKEIYASKQKVENAKIGNGSVSETQFLNLFKIRSKKFCSKLLSDSPGFNDKRKYEIGLTNNLNIRKVLRACNSVRFLFLVNYHELMTDRGGAFRDTALIAAKMISGKHFNNNLESISVFYSHAQSTEMESISSIIHDVQDGLGEVGTMLDADKDLMKEFLNYLLKQITIKDSVIINPLDTDNRENILNKIFKKQGIKDPQDKLNSISFSSESETRLELFCSQVKEQVEEYAGLLKFNEVSQLLDLLHDLIHLTEYDQISNQYNYLSNKIEMNFKYKIDEQIEFVIGNIENGNIFLQHDLKKLIELTRALKEWEQAKEQHFESEISLEYFSSNISEKFCEILKQKKENDEYFELLIKMIQVIDQIKDILCKNSSEKMKQSLNCSLKNLLENQYQRAFKEIEDTIKENNFESESELTKFIQNIQKLLDQVFQKEFLLSKQCMIDGNKFKEDLIKKIENFCNDRVEQLRNYFERTLQCLEEKTNNLPIIEKTSDEENQKKLKSSFLLLMAFTKILKVEVYFPKIIEMKETIESGVKQVLKKYLNLFSIELEKNKLKSIYLTENFMSFLNRFRSQFYINNNEITENYYAFHQQVNKEVKNLQSKAKEQIKSLKNLIADQPLQLENKDDENNNNNNKSSFFNNQNLFEQDPFEKMKKRLDTLKSVCWMDYYQGNKIISASYSSLSRKLEKISVRLSNQLEKIADKITETQDLNQKKKLYQLFKIQYKMLYQMKRKFEEIEPKTKDIYNKTLNCLQTYFKDQQMKEDIINKLNNDGAIKKYLLFEIENNLMISQYIHKDIIQDNQISQGELIEKLDEKFKKQLNSIPQIDQWEIILNDKEVENRFKCWRELLHLLETICKNKQNLSILLEKSNQSEQLFDEKAIKSRIQGIYNCLEKKMAQSLELKEFQKAQEIGKKINSMSESLSNYFQFGFIYDLDKSISQEAQDILIEVGKNNFQSVKDRYFSFKQTNENKQNCEKIEKSLNQQYEKQLKSLLKQIKKIDLKDQEIQQTIEHFFENKVVFEEVLSKDKVIQIFNEQFEVPFCQWQKNDLTNQFLSAKNQINDMVEIFNWYNKIISWMEPYRQEKNKSLQVNLENILIQRIDDEVNEMKSIIISSSISKFNLKFNNFMTKINSYINAFPNIKEFQVQLDAFFQFIDDKFKDLETNYQVSLKSLNEAKEDIKIFKNLYETFSQFNNDKNHSGLIKKLELKLQQKEEKQFQLLNQFFDSEGSRIDQKEMKVILKELNCYENSKGILIHEYLDKKNQECNTRLEEYLKQDTKQFSSFIPLLKQIIKLNQLKEFSSQSVAISHNTENLIKQLELIILDVSNLL